MAIKIDENPTYTHFKIKCEYCGCVFEYDSEDLGYRPWYPKGFVYCPKCGKPLRHNPQRNVYPNPNDVVEEKK
ncbi:MAG: hypothetical protein WCS90_00790 [Bacilli bacterium]